VNESRIEAALQKLDERVDGIEQILPTLATKDDLRGFPTQDDPKGFATKDDFRGFATKDDLRGFATKDDLREFATKDDVRGEGERTRRHFDAVAEEFLSQVKIVSEGTALRLSGTR